MTYKQHDIVLHSINTDVIGIVNRSFVEWWHKDKDYLLTAVWGIPEFKNYLVPYNGALLKPNFTARCNQLGINAPSVYNTTDSPLVRKIKELDYKWEIAMKKKGTFYLTSRAPNVDLETTSQFTQMDIATVSDVTRTRNPLSGRSSRTLHYDEISS